MIITPLISRKTHHGVGYIAGTADGIVTVNSIPAQREIILFDARDLSVVDKTTSLKNGQYMFLGLDNRQEYIMMCRDYKRDYEPCVYDYVKPTTDLTIAEQVELWQSWQNS